MSTFRSILRITGGVAAGAFPGVIAGVSLAYLYDSMDDAPTMIRLPGLNEFVFGICFGLLGALMGLIVGTINLRRLSAVILGAATGAAFAGFWFSFVIAVPRQLDFVLAAAVVPMMALVGLIAAMVFHALPAQSGSR